MLTYTYTQDDGRRLTFSSLQEFLTHMVKRADRQDRVPVLIDTHGGGLDMHELACIDMQAAAPLGAVAAPNAGSVIALDMAVSYTRKYLSKGVHHG